MKKTARNIYLGLILFFMYAPIVTLIVLSFNASKSRAKWGGFTLHWYSSLFQDKAIMAALYNTLLIALVSAVLATIIGTAASIGINAMKSKGKTVMLGITNIPILNSEIVTGISLMLLFIACRVTLGFSTILLAHITFCIPYVILSVLPKLKQTSKSTYEAAQDLGAGPVYAFFKVVFPDIWPGVVSGFLMAFTMSLDDFIITHFTKGPGVDTLSTKIYAEVRKGIRPEMYALSTLLFVSVLVLMICVNASPKETKDVKKSSKKMAFRRTFCFAVPAVLIAALIIGGIFYNLNTMKNHSGEKVIVYNWGEYLDPKTIELFEEETGISVTYEEYETNEIMYPKIVSQAIAYDVVCPSDYMIQRMIENDLLAEINLDNIPNIKNMDPTYMEQSKSFDPKNKYSVPYCVGTVGILYNKSMVKEPVDSWDILWNPKYKDSILMQDSVRDAFAVALKRLGHSINSTEVDQLAAAAEDLMEQKPLVQAYVVDQVRDKMIGNEAALGVIYSGEAGYTKRENPDLEYVIPKEGSNVWIDSWVIPKNAQNKENAEKFINFMCRPEIALMNFEYLTYSTPNLKAREMIEDEEIRNSKILFPEPEDLSNCETFQFLGDDVDSYYNELWNKVKSK
ncbi:extracellular solute-binding protein [Blautia hansenii]|jgi:spermidine/putrescine transport system permease protein|uniref:ABC transporter, solute-binding protein n=1 Tax=Blautia hansenii DSM 20583 TaxID=537007 RepID=C9LB50_BLAHA|nr:extracellular solute-binding protein [Blautia hansenii]ASM69040.1 spermidine/putrescine ABC transporter permease/substrate-binding protein PotCD [Blautia hansenii DSM 20583]EEX20685.1 ABC transporter, solute-binding protein [Blautia hansenii DSM 20583]UWO11627.1 extracellular solute-binding protein [Blautia hansenii DSM 20583]